MAYATRLDFHFLCIFSGTESQALTFPNTKSFLYEYLQINPQDFLVLLKPKPQILSFAKRMWCMRFPHSFFPNFLVNKYIPNLTLRGFCVLPVLSILQVTELENQAKPLLNGEVLWRLVTTLLCVISPFSQTVHHYFFQTLMFLEYGNTD